MNHIFISYARKDQEPVTRVVDVLQKSGLEVWQDILGKRSGIPYSQKWFEVIEEAIFTASGAVIFKSEKWENSVPCMKEYALIQDTQLPHIQICVEELQDREQEIVSQVTRWCRQQNVANGNVCRRWMLSGAHKIYRGLPVGDLYRKDEKNMSWQMWLSICRKVLKETNFRGEWVESLELFLKQAKREMYKGNVKKFLFEGTVLICLVLGLAAFKAFEMGSSFNFVLSEETRLVCKAKRIGISDPVYAMSVLEEYGRSREDHLKEEIDYRAGNRVLAELVSRKYPEAFYASTLECPDDISKMSEKKKSTRYEITLSDKTAQMFLHDQERGLTRQLLLDAVPRTYSFGKSDDILVAAAENRVYVYDLDGKTAPILLSGNFENITRILIKGSYIYAVTEQGHVIVWGNPLLKKNNESREVQSGQMAQCADGRILAVYIDQMSLIVDTDGRQEAFPLPFDGSPDMERIALSPDQAYVAVSYEPDSKGNDMLAVIRLSDGALVRTYDTGCQITGYIFSDDGSSLIAACFDSKRIERISLETGEITESSDTITFAPYGIVQSKENYLISDIKGFLSVFDESLKRVREEQLITAYPVPLKQMVVSQTHGRLFTAGRGGNTLFGNYMMWISGENRDIFLPPEGEDAPATNAVAVTENGEYVAFASPGGSVYLWDFSVMNQVWNVKGIGEPVISMMFTEKPLALHVLGSSGTVNSIGLNGILSEIKPSDTESIWKMLMGKAEEIEQKMQDMGVYQK